MRILAIVLMVLAAAVPAGAQMRVTSVPETVSLQGPRVGATVLSSGVMDRLEGRGIDVAPVITQFGWQFERQLVRTNGLTAVTEWVPLLGGLEQGVALPSLSWLIGLRTDEGLEFGLGPNITPAGVALAVAAGVTVRTGALNVPVNLAVVPSKGGVRISLLTGFTFRRR